MVGSCKAKERIIVEEKPIPAYKKNTSKNIVLDILAIICFIYLPIISSIWLHYSPEKGDLIIKKLGLADIIPTVLSGFWLSVRYSNFLFTMGKKYPILRNLFGNPLIIIVMIVLIEKFFKYIIWR